jgi:hypothetical protein
VEKGGQLPFNKNSEVALWVKKLPSVLKPIQKKNHLVAIGD